MSKQGKIHFSKREVEYLIEKTGDDDPHKALETFLSIAKSEGVEPTRALDYLKILMERDSKAK